MCRAPGGWQHQRFWVSSSLLGLAPGPSRSRRRLPTLGAARGPGWGGPEPSRARAVSSARPLWPCQTLAEHSGSPTPTLLDGQHGLGDVQRPAEAGPAGWGVLWGHCGPSAAFARGSSNLWLQVWEADGDIYWLSWLIICPARRRPASCLEVRAGSARRFRITDGLSVRRRTSPALRQRSSAQRSLALQKACLLACLLRK